MGRLTHLDSQGKAAMVDVSDKEKSDRVATAVGSVTMAPETLAHIGEGGMTKGDLLAVARVAAVMAAKRTSELIPLCHPIALTSITVDFTFDAGRSAVDIAATCRTRDRTGVEMEALTAVSVAALTIYDMCKGVDRKVTIGPIRLSFKKGGRSGTFESAESSDSNASDKKRGTAKRSRVEGE